MYSWVNQRIDRRWPTEGVKMIFETWDFSSLYVDRVYPWVSHRLSTLWLTLQTALEKSAVGLFIRAEGTVA